MPGPQTRAATPWFARPFALLRFATLHTESAVMSLRPRSFARSISAYLISSGLQSGWAWTMIAAAPATCGAANEVPLIVA